MGDLSRSELSLFQLPSLRFQARRYRPHGIGNWSGHLPFAYDLISFFRPKILVELGTHYGESYFAFCQSISENNVECRAYAVDTWKGDIHTGFYSDEVFNEVHAYNEQNYSSFSTLLRMHFDEAAQQFQNESIDLLHIDGMHTYEAVKHDFDLWWPKITPGGIVLFHDSAVRQYDFGVWRLAEELRNSFPVFQFWHSSGLTVMQKPGDAKEDAFVKLIFESDSDSSGIRKFYETVADHLEYEFEKRKAQPSTDITTHLYWRTSEQSFTELESIRASNTIGRDPSQILLPIGPGATAWDEIRVDLTDTFSFIKLHSLTAVDADGAVVWSMSVRDDAENLKAAGLHAVEDSVGLLILDTPAGSSFLLNLSDSLHAGIRSASVLIVGLSSVAPEQFVSAISDAFERHTVELKQEHSATAARLYSVEQMAFERAAELTKFSSALDTAEQSNRKLRAQLDEYIEAFDRTESLALARLAELERYSKALEETQMLVRHRNDELSQTNDEVARLTKVLEEAQCDLVDLRNRLFITTTQLSESRLALQLKQVDADKLRSELLVLRARNR